MCQTEPARNARETDWVVDWDTGSSQLLLTQGCVEAAIHICPGSPAQLRDQLHEAIRVRMDAASDLVPDTEAVDGLGLVYQVVREPYGVLMSGEIPLPAREALLDALAEVYAEVGTDYFLRRRVALLAVGADMFARAPRNGEGATAAYLDARMIVAGREWLKGAADISHRWQPDCATHVEADTRDWFLSGQGTSSASPIPLAERIQSWLYADAATARQRAIRATNKHAKTAMGALRPEWRDLFVDTWALRARLDPAMAQAGEIAAAQGPRRRFLAFSRLPILVLGRVLLLVGAVSVMAHLLGWSGWVTGNAWWPWLVLLAAVAHLVAVTVGWPRLGQVFVPRLGAVSVIGYLALAQLHEARALNELGPGVARGVLWLGLPIVSALAVGAYLWVGQVAPRARLRAWPMVWRVRDLLLLGLCHSVAIGVVCYPLLVGRLPEPDELLIVWIWAPMALAIGIIAQTLWQRDAITEPI